MASIEELERRDVEIRLVERRALVRLAEHLREAIRDLPSESKLALVFVQQARALEACAQASTPSLGARFHLDEIEQEFQGNSDEDEGGDA